MEKSLGYGFEYYMDLIPGMKQADPKASSSIVLAYIGDCVFDLIIKMRVVGRGGRQVHKLHEETSRYVQASAQSFMMRAIQEHLTEEEHAVYRRGKIVILLWQIRSETSSWQKGLFLKIRERE